MVHRMSVTLGNEFSCVCVNFLSSLQTCFFFFVHNIYFFVEAAQRTVHHCMSVSLKLYVCV